MAEKKSIHSGHRQRLKERFLRDGLDGFEKHNMLELLLFYTIPQKDTNPIAHALLDRFGSLGGVFSASVDELCTVSGVSEHTATLIKLIPEMWRNVACEIRPDVRYDSVNKLGRLMIDRLSGLTVETIILVLMDNSWHILEIIKLGEGSVNQVRMDTRKLIEHAIRTNAAMALLAHNHPNGTLVASPEDLVTTTAVAAAFQTIRVEFLEHLLVAGDRYLPLLSQTEGVFWQKSKTNAFYDKD
ncbi:MAG: RadC family protein [Clostridia bacterium]|nr:RadC family protein [Clostridia bacterium]